MWRGGLSIPPFLSISSPPRAFLGEIVIQEPSIRERILFFVIARLKSLTAYLETKVGWYASEEPGYAIINTQAIERLKKDG